MLKKKRPRGYMSADELKLRMLEHFRESGTLDGLQTQLRSKLIQEVLKFSSPGKKDEASGKSKADSALLPLQVSNWLICEHLKRHKFEYALSTFMSEANLTNIDNLLSIIDVLAVIGLEKGSPSYESLYNDFIKGSSDSFLTMFLKSIMKVTKSEPLVKIHETGNKPLEEVNSFHPAKVFRGIFHEGTSTSGICSAETEDNSVIRDCLKLEHEKHQQEIQNLHQKLLHQLDSLHEQEKEAQIEIEQTKRRLALEREMLEVEKEKLKMKENQLQVKEEHINKEIDAKVKMQKERLFSSFRAREAELWKTKLKEQQQWFESEIAKMKSNDAELDLLKTKLLHMEKSYKSLQSDYCAILNENEKLKMNLKEMLDYSSIKEELSWKSKKLESYEREIMNIKSEMQAEKLDSLHTIQRLQHQLRLSAQKYSVEPFSQNVSSSSLQSQKQEKEAAEMKQSYLTVLKRLEEQREDIQELHRIVHSLYDKMVKDQHSQITATKEAASNTNLGEDLTRVKILHTVSQDIPPHHQQSFNIYEEPLKFISDAKKRIQVLHKESQAIEQKYAEYLSDPHHHIPDLPLTQNLFLDMPSRNNYPLFTDVPQSGPVLPKAQSYQTKPFLFSFHDDPTEGLGLQSLNSSVQRYRTLDLDTRTNYTSSAPKDLTSTPLLSTAQFPDRHVSPKDFFSGETESVVQSTNISNNKVSCQPTDSIDDQSKEKCSDTQLTTQIHASETVQVTKADNQTTKEISEAVSADNLKEQENASMVNKATLLDARKENTEMSVLKEATRLETESFSASKEQSSQKSSVLPSAKPSDEIHIVPFQRLRRISLTPPLGFPVVDLNEAWRQQKSNACTLEKSNSPIQTLAPPKTSTTSTIIGDNKVSIIESPDLDSSKSALPMQQADLDRNSEKPLASMPPIRFPPIDLNEAWHQQKSRASTSEKSISSDQSFMDPRTTVFVNGKISSDKPNLDSPKSIPLPEESDLDQNNVKATVSETTFSVFSKESHITSISSENRDTGVMPESTGKLLNSASESESNVGTEQNVSEIASVMEQPSPDPLGIKLKEEMKNDHPSSNKESALAEKEEVAESKEEVQSKSVDSESDKEHTVSRNSEKEPMSKSVSSHESWNQQDVISEENHIESHESELSDLNLSTGSIKDVQDEEEEW